MSNEVLTKKNIMGVFPDPADATSFYRGMGPFGEMRKLNSVHYEYTPFPKGIQLTWAVMQQGDILFLQRPFTDAHLTMANIAKYNGLKLWVDFDDDLLNIPMSNYTHKIYKSRQATKHITEIMKLADLCTVSTQCLKDVYGMKSERVHVVPNAINTRIFKMEKRKPSAKKNNKQLKVFWRGGKSHIEDMLVFSDALHKAAVDNPNVLFMYCGEPEWPIMQRLSGVNNVEFLAPMDVIQYHYAYKNMAPDISIVPLKDNQFNHGKSMCAWLEATYAGSACLGPSFDEWKRKGVYNYQSADDFNDRLNELLASEELRLKCQNESVDTIEQSFTLDVNSLNRFELIERLYS